MVVAETLARARVAAATGRWPPDLARDVVDLLEELAPVAERIAARDVLLRQAAELMTGSRWARALRIEREIADLVLAPGLRPPHQGDEVRGLVAAALQLADAPERRQLLRLLAA